MSKNLLVKRFSNIRYQEALEVSFLYRLGSSDGSSSRLKLYVSAVQFRLEPLQVQDLLVRLSEVEVIW